ncbi:MAG: 4Fe-4S binding protein [Candidatus Brocadiia bacterium]
MNALRCNACGLCAEECPSGAVRVTYIAVIRRDRCTGCGVCSEGCPVNAISMAVPAGRRGTD